MLTEDDVVVHELESLDSIEAQAKRVAGMEREKQREMYRLRQMQLDSSHQMHGETGNHHDSSSESAEAQVIDANLRHQRTEAPARMRRGNFEECDAGQLAANRKEKRRKKQDPYAKIPFYVPEIM
jgi:hypothetical protein